MARTVPFLHTIALYLHAAKLVYYYQYNYLLCASIAYVGGKIKDKKLRSPHPLSAVILSAAKNLSGGPQRDSSLRSE